MNLRDKLEDVREKIENDQETITFYLSKGSASTEVRCHHHELMEWLTNIVNIAIHIANDAELDEDERKILAVHWVQDFMDIKDERFKDDEEDD